MRELLKNRGGSPLRIFLLSLTVAVPVLLACEHACASTITSMEESSPKILYLKRQTFSYLLPYAKEDYIAGVYGQGEAVKVTDRISVRMAGEVKKQTFYLTEHFGKIVYIPASQLTEKKPEWVYFVKNSCRKLVLNGNASLHVQPCFSSRKISCSEQVLYTLGETNRWYKVFYRGEVAFLHKQSARIERAGIADFPEMEFQTFSQMYQWQLRNRIQYAFSMIPQKVRERLLEEVRCIHVAPHLPKAEYEDMGASGYACSDGNIYLKETEHEDSDFMVELSLLHELGHILDYIREPAERTEECLKCLDEKERLQLYDYYMKDREYMAETFEIFVRNPLRLQENAPATYAYFKQLTE